MRTPVIQKLAKRFAITTACTGSRDENFESRQYHWLSFELTITLLWKNSLMVIAPAMPNCEAFTPIKLFKVDDHSHFFCFMF